MVPEVKNGKLDGQGEHDNDGAAFYIDSRRFVSHAFMQCPNLCCHPLEPGQNLALAGFQCAGGANGRAIVNNGSDSI